MITYIILRIFSHLNAFLDSALERNLLSLNIVIYGNSIKENSNTIVKAIIQFYDNMFDDYRVISIIW